MRPLAVDADQEVPGSINSQAPGSAALQSGTSDPENPLATGADLEIGAPRKGAPRTSAPNTARWHSRGYLPHFDSPDRIQHVTFHLADSLPRDAVVRMERSVQSVSPEKRDMERRRQFERWIDAGHGSCVLGIPEIARLTQNALLFFDQERYRLFAWVVMPNHVHVLFQTCNGWAVSAIVASWKKFTARRIGAYLRNTQAPGTNNPPAPGSAALQSGTSDPKNPLTTDADLEIGAPRGVPSPIWGREYWDRFIRNTEHFQKARDYIHHNPVKAGLAPSPEAWPWSSAAYH